jgi:hypothetical protein
MVIVHLAGGLGNQLFQYAAARRLAQVHNVTLKLDLMFYQRTSFRHYRLDQFQIVAAPAYPAEIARFCGRSKLVRQLRLLANRLRPYTKRSWVIERHFHFDPAVLRLPQDVYLQGHWQSEGYFKEIEPLVRQELTLRAPPDAQNAAILDRIQSTQSVSLHIRRTDYLHNPVFYREDGPCTLDYYQAAIKHLAEAIEMPELFVFTDDPAWARANLQSPCRLPLTFLEHNGEERDFEDLRLMSACKHHILANSSFSWWGAWLGTHPAQVVVAPQTWLNDPAYDPKDIILQSWHTIGPLGGSRS